MSKFRKNLIAFSCLVILGLGILLQFKIGLDLLGIRFNLTPSEPRGIYALEAVSERPQRGNLVTFCLDYDNPYSALAATRGYLGDGSCSSGLKPLLKRLAGLPGDKLKVTPDGIILNGSYLAGTARPEFDSQGRAMPDPLLEDGEIPEGMALVISQRLSNSFDSRFFGFIPYDSLIQVTPVLTKKETPAACGQNEHHPEESKSMTDNNREENVQQVSWEKYLSAAIKAVEDQVSDDPILGIPVDQDVAAQMGAFDEDPRMLEAIDEEFSVQ